jgi:hypothetical protein
MKGKILNPHLLTVLSILIIGACAPFASAFQGTPAELSRIESSPSFSAGERLVYSIKWDPPWYLFFLPSMGAGEVEILLAGDAPYRNKNAQKIIFHATSSGALARLTGLHIANVFTYYNDPATFCTRGVDNIVREGNRKRHIEAQYHYDTNQLHFREINEAVDPSEVMKDIVVEDIPACVHDPVSALFFYRTMELHRGHTQALIVGNNDRINKVNLQVEKEETLATSIGKINSWKVNVTSLLGELFKESGRLSIWFSRDETRLPLQFEIRVRLGKVLGVLKEYDP